MTTPTDHPDIEQRAAKAVRRQERAAKAAERRKRIERIAFSVTEAADALGRDPATVWRWLKSDVIRATRIGGVTMIAKAELDRVLASGGPPRGRPPRTATGQFTKEPTSGAG